MIAFLSRLSRYAAVLIFATMTAMISSCRVDRVTQRHTDVAHVDDFAGPAADTCFHMPVEASAVTYRELMSPDVYSYYRSKGFAMAWGHPDDPTQGVAGMIEMIRTVRLYGLLPQDYHLGEIESIRGNSDCESRVRMDALLTDALFTMGSHIGKGRLSPVVVDSILLENFAGLTTPAALRSYFESREPNYEGYRLLRSALISIYDTLDTKDREMLMEGVTDDSMAVHKVIRSVEINLERWRWEREAVGPDHVWINIPAFEISVVRDGIEVLRSKAIVGAPGTRTPVFSSTIECFTVYPYWHVPRSIAVNEYLPAIQKNVSFIPLNNMDVLDSRGNLLGYDTLPWHTYDRHHFPVLLRQREGTHNALGIVKFQFDNPYAVLLHDTNAKRLFQYQKRAFSHGCIRMEKAVEFAHYLAQTYTLYTAEQMAGYLSAGTRRTVELSRPLPIHIRYFTCAYDGGVLRHYDDVYGQDRQLEDRFYRDATASTVRKAQ